MNLTKISHVAGVRYLLNSVAVGDRSAQVAGGMAAYYAAAGTPPGRWWGKGAATLGIAGGQVTKTGAETLFSEFASPVTGLPLGTPPRELRDLPDGAKPQDQPAVVSGFDLTFTIPKSVSVLWALSDQATQARILAAHHRAVDRALAWTEREVIATRSGRGGVVSSPVVGMLAARFDHWDTRDGDPHLHTHVAVANRVQRRHDGKWMTLDGAALYRAAVAVSELHENALLDELHHDLGLDFTERARTTTRATKAVVLDVTGIPADLVERFSSRARQVEMVEAELLDRFRAGHGGREPSRRELARLHQQAWAATRAPKDKDPRPLADLVAGWRDQTRALGHRPADVVAAALGHPRRAAGADHVAGDADVVRRLATHLIAATLDAEHQHLAAEMADEQIAGAGTGSVVRIAAETALGATKKQRTTWTRANLRSEAERLTSLVRCAPGTREVMIEAITDAALARCVRLTPVRYRLPETAADDPRFDTGVGGAGPDDPQSLRYSHHTILDAEAHLHALATETTTPAALTPEAADTALAPATSGDGTHPPLAADQLAAARAVVTEPAMLSAVVGAAGTGKTTTMAAVRTAWEAQHGAGSVTGLATSARAAAELSDALGIHTTTIAKHLWESTGGGLADRAARRSRAQSMIATGTPRQRAAGRRILADVLADDATYRLRPGQLVIVDEASMTGTLDLHRIAEQVEAVGGKLLLVGDPAQLGAPDAGGMLGWLHRTGTCRRLTSLWRFADPDEAEATLALRDGDASVLDEEEGFYATHGRIEHGDTEQILEGAYGAVRRAQADGRHAILIAATNGQVTDLNRRFTLDRRADGTVDTTRTVALRDGLDAGIGDVILTRKVDRLLRDATGRPVYNGDLFTVTAIAPDGSVHATRNDGGGQSVTLPAEYLTESTELGYATTAHRAQGITGDEAHLATAYGENMTRELLYVGMSRARHTNCVWVGLPDSEQLRAEHVRPQDGPDATAILIRAMAAEQSERTAHEIRAAEHADRFGLPRLIAEHDYLTALAAGPSLDAALRATHGDAFTDHARTGDVWESLAALWHTAQAIDPARAGRLLALPISHPDPTETALLADDDGQDDGESFDPVAVLHSRLSHALVYAPIGLEHARTWTAGLLPPLHTQDPALADMAHQNHTLIADHLTQALRTLHAERPAWARGLPERPDTETGRLAWDRMAGAVIAFRELHEITTDTPLGPPPAPDADRRYVRDRARVSHLLSTWDQVDPPVTYAPEVDRWAEVDWPTDIPTAESPRPDWRPVDLVTQADTEEAVTDRPASTRVPVPVTDPEALRAIEVNTAAWQLWSTPPAGSWVPAYLTDRGLPDADAGHAPAGWTTTLDALRHRGFTDADLLAAGIATTTSTGRLIDRFRDRLVIPVRNTADQIVGFTARVSPHETWTEAPKYINTPATAAYDKSALLLGLDADGARALAAGARPVIVEGAMDVEAVRALGDPDLVPLAPCGTAITTTQLAVLAAARPDGLDGLLVAFDPDTAGRKAATRLWTMLDPHEASTAQHVDLPAGTDPADMVAFGHHDLLAAALAAPEPLTTLAVDHTVDTVLDRYAADRAREQLRAAADVLAVLPPQAWHHEIAEARDLLGRTVAASLAGTEIERILRARLDQRWDEQIIAARDRRPARPRTAGEDSELVQTARESWGLPGPITPVPLRTDPGRRTPTWLTEDRLDRLRSGARLVFAGSPEHVRGVDVAVPLQVAETLDRHDLAAIRDRIGHVPALHLVTHDGDVIDGLWSRLDGPEARSATCEHDGRTVPMWHAVLDHAGNVRTADDQVAEVAKGVADCTAHLGARDRTGIERRLAARFGDAAVIAYRAEARPARPRLSCAELDAAPLRTSGAAHGIT